MMTRMTRRFVRSYHSLDGFVGKSGGGGAWAVVVVVSFDVKLLKYLF